ncbi:hypothetical protein PFLUV_G00170930 [Perca fluviatilis]|uniref:Uncharacterized protein n=1 Tax=Perca fluviatilis TaxID=8168 RepID=A0A6A5EZG2_PERFL|nr:hypothetical protein PFLUV_G00170930 [Perca fluviatilis]
MTGMHFKKLKLKTIISLTAVKAHLSDFLSDHWTCQLFPISFVPLIALLCSIISATPHCIFVHIHLHCCLILFMFFCAIHPCVRLSFLPPLLSHYFTFCTTCILTLLRFSIYIICLF